MNQYIICVFIVFLLIFFYAMIEIAPMCNFNKRTIKKRNEYENENEYDY